MSHHHSRATNDVGPHLGAERGLPQWSARNVITRPLGLATGPGFQYYSAVVRNEGLWQSLSSTSHLTDGATEALKSHVICMIMRQVRGQGRIVTHPSDPHSTADCLLRNGGATGFLSSQIYYLIPKLLSLAH